MGDFFEQFYDTFIVKSRWTWLLQGLGNTMIITIAAVVLGIALGFFIAIIRTTHDKTGKLIVPNILCRVYLTDIRGTPVIVQLLIIYFVIFATVDIEKWIIAAIAFGINSGAYVSEIIRAGILSIDKGQTEAGRSLGLNAYQTMTRIVIPQALKNIFPALCNEFIVLIKETAIVGYVGLMDIQKAGDFIKSATYEAFMPLIGTAIIYYVLIKVLTLILGVFENKLRKSDIR